MEKVASAAHGRFVTSANRPGDTLPAEGPGVSLTEGYHMQRQPKEPAQLAGLIPHTESGNSAGIGAMNGC